MTTEKLSICEKQVLSFLWQFSIMQLRITREFFRFWRNSRIFLV